MPSRIAASTGSEIRRSAPGEIGPRPIVGSERERARFGHRSFQGSRGVPAAPAVPCPSVGRLHRASPGRGVSPPTRRAHDAGVVRRACDALAADERAGRVERGDGAEHQRRGHDAPERARDVVGVERDPRGAQERPCAVVHAHAAVSAARHEHAAACHGHVLRRRADGEPDARRERAEVVHGDVVGRPRGDPEARAVGGDDHVVGPVDRRERADEPRAPRVARVEHRDRRRLRAERDEQRAAVGRDGEVPRTGAHCDASGDACARKIDHHQLAPLGVGHVRVAAAGRRRGVARLAEPLELVAHPQRRDVEQGERAEVGMPDERRRAASDGLDAARPCEGADVHPLGAGREVEHDDARLVVRGGEHERRASCRGGRLRERGCRGGGDAARGEPEERATMHAPSTCRRALRVRAARAGRRAPPRRARAPRPRRGR